MIKKPDMEKGIRHQRRHKHCWKFETLIRIYMVRAGTEEELYRLPSYLHCSSASEDSCEGTTEKGYQSKAIDHNVRSRHASQSKAYWMTLWQVYAPDLWYEAMEENLEYRNDDLPPGFFEGPKKWCGDEIQKLRRSLLFQWSLDGENLRSLRFFPEKDITVVDGHMLTVTPQQLMFLFFFPRVSYWEFEASQLVCFVFFVYLCVGTSDATENVFSVTRSKSVRYSGVKVDKLGP